MNNKQKYTDAELIQNLKDAALYYKHSPSTIEYDKYPNKICSNTCFRNRYGSWDNALALAELPFHKRTLSKKILIQNLKDVVSDLGYIPSRKEYNAHPLHICQSSTFYHYFRSWEDALQKSKLTQNYCTNYKHISRDAIIKSIYQLTETLGHTPIQKEYLSYPNRVCGLDYINKMFGSWNKMLEEIGLCKNRDRYIEESTLLKALYDAAINNPDIYAIKPLMLKTKYARNTYAKLGNAKEIKKKLYLTYGIKIEKKQCLKDSKDMYVLWVKKYITEYGRSPTSTEFQEYSGLNLSSLQPHKLINLNELIYQANGHLNHITSSAQRKLPASYIKQEIIWRIKTVYQELLKKGTPIYTDISHAVSEYCNRKTINKFFGSMKKAIETAKIPVKPTYGVYTEKELLNSLRKVAKSLGYSPTQKEYATHPLRLPNSINIFRNHFGSWNNVLIAAKLPARRYKTGMSKKMILKNLSEILKKIGHRPGWNEYQNMKDRFVSTVTLKKMFGSYKEAWDLVEGLKTQNKSKIKDGIMH